MRLDLFEGGRRPWFLKLPLALVSRYVGLPPGPPIAISYRPDLFDRAVLNYVFRSSSGLDGWDRGHAELFSAFVSQLNRCRF